MNSKVINLIKNFSYTLTSNLVSLIISTLVVLIVPRLIGIKEYGYFQLYLFYSSYVGFFHFGWNDGIYLRYGGKEYQDLDKSLFFSQFYMVVIMQLLIVGIIFSISSFFINENRAFIFKMISLGLFSVNVRSVLLSTLQSTNKIKEYSQIIMIGRILYCCLITGFLIIGIRNYEFMIIADVIGKFVSLLYAMYYCKDIVFRRITTFYISLREAVANISVGIKLMFANIASNLIIGTIRFGIERSWDVSTFGKVSLTLSISSLMMVFINAIGIVLFPILRRTNKDKLSNIYVTMRAILMVVLLGLLITYYPLKIFLLVWLPKYANSLKYMVLLYPIFVYEGKISLLINTFLNTLRKEKLILRINLISLILSIIITIVTTLVLKNLNLAIASIMIIMVFKSILAEIFICKILEISLYKEIGIELIMTFIFILTGFFRNYGLAALVYLVVYMVYLVIKQNTINKTISNVKALVKA